MVPRLKSYAYDLDGLVKMIFIAMLSVGSLKQNIKLLYRYI